MAKNTIADFDTTADNNTDIAGIDIRGSAPPQNFDNAFRALMSCIKTLYNSTSAFMRTVLDDPDAATARATLAISDAFLRYDAAQTLTGALLAQAQANLRAILGGPYEIYRVTATGTAWVFDFPDTATSFRVTLDGVRIASGSGAITMRCGPAAGSAEAGVTDYLNKAIFAQDGATSASATLVNSSTMPVAAVGAAGRTYARIEGSLGSATSPFQGDMSVTDGDALLNSIADRRFTRLSSGRKGRLFVYSDVALTGGTITVEAKA